MENYQSNSHKAREEKKKLEKVVTGKVKVRKKSEFRKLADVFVPEDINELKTHLLIDVIIPKLKSVLADIGRSAIDVILYGEESADSRRYSSLPKISYSKYSKDTSRTYGQKRNRMGYEFEEASVESRGEAEEILMRMEEMIDTYGLVSIADYHDLLGLRGQYTDNKYGWTSLRNASVVRVSDGYMIRFPKAFPLD